MTGNIICDYIQDIITWVKVIFAVTWSTLNTVWLHYIKSYNFSVSEPVEAQAPGHIPKSLFQHTARKALKSQISSASSPAATDSLTIPVHRQLTKWWWPVTLIKHCPDHLCIILCMCNLFKILNRKMGKLYNNAIKWSEWICMNVFICTKIILMLHLLLLCNKNFLIL